MPTVLRRSGPDMVRDGKPFTPRGMIHRCEDCGFVGAAFGIRSGDKLLSYCGWKNGNPICIGKAKSHPDLLAGAA